MTSAPGLVRFAARFAPSIDDAEDAYQRAMEIALTKAPVTDSKAFISWLHTVIRREAIGIADARRRELPVTDEELETGITVTAHANGAPQPDAVLEWRERYRAVQDAMVGLTDSQRVCLMLRSAGASREEIQSLTGFSERKVHRSISEGRARLHAWEVRMAAGEECGKIADLIDRAIDDTASRRERRTLSRHIGHCPSCRSRYRSRREQVRLIGALVPTVLVGAQLLHDRPPDPAVVLTWWDRVSGSAHVKAAQAFQMVSDLPALASTKAGAGAIAATAAGVVGAPVVIHAVKGERVAERPVAAAVSPGGSGAVLSEVPQRSAASSPTEPPAKPKAKRAITRPGSATPARRTKSRIATTRGLVRVRTTASTPKRYAYRVPPRTTTQRKAATTASPALEFGP